LSTESPRLERSITLRLQGDWGMANFHRACGWLSEEMGERCGRHSRFFIQNGRGGFDAALAVHRGEVDLALTTPALFVRMAVEGKGPYAGERLNDLRAIGLLPQWDRLVLAVDAGLGIRSYEELRARRVPLKIAASVDDGSNHIGYATRRLMEAEGISEETLKEWGGRYVTFERPDQCVAAVRRGEANAVYQEAIMTRWWREFMESRAMTLLSLSDAALAEVKNRFGWERGDLPAGYFPTQTSPVAALDYSDFAVLVRADMAEDVAHLLTWCLVETRGRFEAQYHHLPRERSPVSYPLVPQAMAKAPMPLHPGAARYYRTAGYL
jgi:uncharacterized protein